MYSTVENLKLTFVFSAQYDSAPPVIEIKNNNQTILTRTEITETQEYKLDICLPNDSFQLGSLQIIRSNFNGFDQQLLNFDKLYLDDINLNKICHQSKYYPIYPEPWLSQQQAAGNIWPEYLTGVMSWGWNGLWVLDYEMPIYTWLLKNV
jgi:hypothetical protein